MADYKTDLRDVKFTLFEYLKVQDLQNSECFSEWDKDGYEEIINQAYRFAQEKIGPTNEDGDKIRVRDRKFVEIDKENFNKVMRSISPEARVEVEDRLTGGGNRVVAELKFQSMEDFRPENVARQVPALKELLEVREELARLRRKLDGKAKAENVLFRAIERTIAMMEGGSTGGKEDEE